MGIISIYVDDQLVASGSELLIFGKNRDDGYKLKITSWYGKHSRKNYLSAELFLANGKSIASELIWKK